MIQFVLLWLPELICLGVGDVNMSGVMLTQGPWFP